MRLGLKSTRGRVLLLAIVVVLGVVVWWVAASSGSRFTSLDLTLQQLEEDVRKDPQNPDSRLAVAIAYAARGYNTSAIQQFQEVLKLQPENQTAMMGLGRTLLTENKLDEALEPLLKVAEMNKDNPRKHILDQLEAVYYDLGVIYSRKGNYEEATSYLGQALEINSTDADAWLTLAQVHEKRGELQQAIEAYERVVGFVPDYEEAYQGMAKIYGTLKLEGQKAYAEGMVHLINKDYDKALASLSKAVQLAPAVGQVHQGYAITLETRGRKEEALASYKKALELNPDLVLAQLAVQRMERQ